jgi:hypothetical protein
MSKTKKKSGNAVIERRKTKKKEWKCGHRHGADKKNVEGGW